MFGQWGAPFDLGLVAVNTVMMHTGKVLMYSGSFATSAVERVWDPATGSLTLVPNPYYNLFCAGQSQLADGRILVVGGYDSASLGAANANIFDPVDANLVGAAEHGLPPLVSDLDDAAGRARAGDVGRADLPDVSCRHA